jgi:hypothetical protein
MPSYRLKAVTIDAQKSGRDVVVRIGILVGPTVPL